MEQQQIRTSGAEVVDLAQAKSGSDIEESQPSDSILLGPTQSTLPSASTSTQEQIHSGELVEDTTSDQPTREDVVEITDEEMEGTKVIEDTPKVSAEVKKGWGTGDVDMLEDLERTFIQATPAHNRPALIEFLSGPRSSHGSDEELMKKYAAFIDKELSLSRRRNYIIKPPGSMDSLVGIMMHYPTFSCDKKHYIGGECADASSPCPALLMSKGFSANNTFWFEACFRREKAPRDRSNPMTAYGYSFELRECHRAFSRECEEALNARVILVVYPE